MKIALLGLGHIGRSIARRLSESGDYEVIAADRDEQAFAGMRKLGVVCQTVDFGDDHALRRFLKQAHAAVNALPYTMATPVATAAKIEGVHYFDLTEDVRATLNIIELAEGADTAFMPQCGLAPGFVGIAAHHQAMAFDEIHEIKMRVGALPEFPTNQLKYNLTWSIDGLLNEYSRPGEAIRNGSIRGVEPLEGLERFSLDGIEYEAFNTSGGLGTLCRTLLGRAENLDYKSIRYPGHCRLVKFLLQELRLNEKRDVLKEILHDAIPATMQDIVLVFISVDGMLDGRRTQQVFTTKIYAGTSGSVRESAIQITTAAGLCAALDLFREEKLPQKGLIRQEMIRLPDFLKNRFGRVYDRPRES